MLYPSKNIGKDLLKRVRFNLLGGGRRKEITNGRLKSSIGAASGTIVPARDRTVLTMNL